jgi:DNA-binding PadR family transcriptional regulator
VKQSQIPNGKVAEAETWSAPGQGEPTSVRRIPARAGNLAYALLGLVAGREEGVHGYLLRQELESLCDDAGQVNYGRLYSTLEMLARTGHLTLIECIQHDRPNRKVYQITNVGQQCLDEWLLTPVSEDPRPLRDELGLKLLFLDRTRLDTLSAQIDRQRSHCLSRLARMVRRKKRLHKAKLEPAAVEIVLQGPEMRLHADLAWLKQIELKILAPRDESGAL